MTKTTQPALIVGAGLAGLIAGYAFPGVPILEAGGSELVPHRALLRFRSDAVSRLTGIPFRQVRVHKGIWFEGSFIAPNVQVANLYSRKCLDRVRGDRSIWNIDPVDRWVGPEDLVEQMTEALSHRISWGEPFDFALQRIGAGRPRDPIISTAALSIAMQSLDIHPTEKPELMRAPIWVKRYRVECADAHQTVYFPGHDLNTYRASLTGDLLIVEARNDPDSLPEALRPCGPPEIETVAHAMGLSMDTITPIDSGDQRYGKIVPLADEPRRGWLARLTIESNIYSLGRFATWRNVLLDDVVQDAEVIRRMLRSSGSTNFHALRQSAGR